MTTDILLERVASYPILFALCALSGIIPMPEDVPVLVAGIAAAAGELDLFAAMAVATAGVLLRDLLFYGIGRMLGDTLLENKWVNKLIGTKQLEKARELVQERGPFAVLMGRFFIGFRTPIFLAAGALGVKSRDFILWDLLGLAVMVPAMLMVGYAFGEPSLAALQWVVSNAWMLVMGPIALFICGQAVRPRPVAA